MDVKQEIENLSEEKRKELYEKALRDRDIAKLAISKHWNQEDTPYLRKRMTEIAAVNHEKVDGYSLKGVESYFYNTVILFGSDEEFENLLLKANSKTEIISAYTGINPSYVKLRKLIYNLNGNSKKEKSFI